MSSKPSLVAYVVEQLGPDVRSRPMFGEYGLYKADTLIALFCDDQLFLKQTDAVRALLQDTLEEGLAYPGAKPSILITAERWDNSDLMQQLATLTRAGLIAKGAEKPKPRPPAKKTVAKKTVAKKTVAKKTVAKKTVAKKTVAKKTVAKKTVAKKTVAKKNSASKPAAAKKSTKRP